MKKKKKKVNKRTRRVLGSRDKLSQNILYAHCGEKPEDRQMIICDVSGKNNM